MSGKILLRIEETEEDIRVAGTVNGELADYFLIKKSSREGTIARGRVSNVGYGGARVDLPEGIRGYLPYVKGIRSGDFLTLRVVRDAVGDKRCLLSEKLKLVGRYVVAVSDKTVKYSRGLSEGRKAELPAARGGCGIIFRSSCEHAENSAVEAEAETLCERLADIVSEGGNRWESKILYKPDLRVLAECEAASEKDLLYGFDDKLKAEIATLGNRIVEFGGIKLTFDKTEAMTVIDVDSHLYKGGGDVESRIFGADVSAVKEICRQIRLKNIGGIIAVDFITLSDSKYKKKLEETLLRELSPDRLVRRTTFDGVFCVALINRERRFSGVDF